MTNKQAIQLAKRVETWQERLKGLGIGHYEIERVSCVDETPGGPNANATVHTAKHYDVVIFWFKNDYLDEADEGSIDRTIIHEWIHVAMRDFDAALEAVEAWMPERTYEDWEERIDHEREGLVERFARQLYSAHIG